MKAHTQRCLSGLRSTIGNRVTGELVRRFKSSSLRQKIAPCFGVLFSYIPNFEEDLRVGAVLREQNALPNGAYITKYSTAKATIDNCRAGRDAKVANPLLCASISKTFGNFVEGLFFVFFRKISKFHPTFYPKNKEPNTCFKVICDFTLVLSKSGYINNAVKNNFSQNNSYNSFCCSN